MTTNKETFIKRLMAPFLRQPTRVAYLTNGLKPMWDLFEKTNGLFNDFEENITFIPTENAIRYYILNKFSKYVEAEGVNVYSNDLGHKKNLNVSKTINNYHIYNQESYPEEINNPIFEIFEHNVHNSPNGSPQAFIYNHSQWLPTEVTTKIVIKDQYKERADIKALIQRIVEEKMIAGKRSVIHFE
ncbi:hypothetical protein [Aureibacter tunicatorum]|uniref:Uncharacterized protein n=1 Tax=Aureibacter tunicatorum TaxID=866807 RepID=A0AAE4BT94_9BACT|nr:hypothetical protein [Aureibacter tunicatorum]MDR6241959.1 hypothetical protein [Aureibacter tunicatorum]BDD07512.1 hypothetical protein AUTU_49950 [Aureibacter tunicatorum]